ncbi:MAG: hydroxyisourate hydrolase [Pyrinomonadaceae bacterium]
MSAITTHILDTSTGKPGAGIPVVLERKTHSSGWQDIADGITDVDGRVSNFIAVGDVFLPGHYRLIFETGAYYLLSNIECFFPQITVSFVVKDATQHFHVPLLLSPFGYSTYRGS